MAQRRFLPGAFLALAALIWTGCITPTGATPDERRRSAREMRADSLEAFYRAAPELRSAVPSASGYAVFSDIDIQIFLIGASNGYGIAHDNDSGLDTYMHMAGGSVGVGVGAKDSRLLFVFHDPGSFEIFTKEGWEFGGDADAAAIAGGNRGAQANATSSVTSSGAAISGSGTAGWSGGRGSGAASAGRRVDVYQLTKNGLVLKAALSGSRYWQDTALN